MKRIVINRKIWRTATHGVGITQLRNLEGFKCCLGFMCEQLGFAEIYGNTDFSEEAIVINDNNELDDVSREAKLIELGLKHGVEFVFEGDY